MRRRRLIFSSAIDGDFTLQTLSAGRHRVVLYRAGLESASAIVVQSRQQLELARRALRRVPRLECIPSFAEDPPEPELPRPAPEAFLWIGRLIDYKRPLQYLELARAMPETHFWMLGVSNESQSYAAEIVERATGMPNLELLEPRPHAETMQLVRRAIAIVSTSRLEGMPNVFLEAWGRGVPVLSLSFDPDGIIEANDSEQRRTTTGSASSARRANSPMGAATGRVSPRAVLRTSVRRMRPTPSRTAGSG